MRLAIVTINYNNAERTIALLNSLERQLIHDAKLYVVDNASEPGDKAELEAHITATRNPNIDFIPSFENRGFSGGNNLAIKKAISEGVEWIACINNDTAASEGFVATLLERLSKLQPSVAGIPLAEDDKIAYAGMIKWFSVTLPHIYNLASARINSRRIYAIGGGVAFHRSVIDKIGLWDERYFLYFEDADFSVRARKAGFLIISLEQPILRHAGSASTKKLGHPLLLRYHARNALLFASENAPVFVKILLFPWSAFAIVKQYVKIMLFPARREKSRAILEGMFDFYGRRFGKIMTTHDPHWHRM